MLLSGADFIFCSSKWNTSSQVQWAEWDYWLTSSYTSTCCVCKYIEVKSICHFNTWHSFSAVFAECQNTTNCCFQLVGICLHHCGCCQFQKGSFSFFFFFCKKPKGHDINYLSGGTWVFVIFPWMILLSHSLTLLPLKTLLPCAQTRPCSYGRKWMYNCM